ncbi:tetratricopeptide repeat protein [Flavobacterium sp. D11R37]|uniref:tetratricopeptide repeat protein n=1 Tax=Flavobacterium coralii TaxID=2838017 RepID=UPI001CA6D900|nr:tetratricopeptide repeat protein [Flavobacterium coralii]MBY8961523.1 tetratricopeptide repeat protein [Flavobacterium coralii]
MNKRNTFVKYICCITLLVMCSMAYAQGSDEYFKMAKEVVKEKGNFAKAAEYCEKALDLAPLDMDIKEYLGKCYMELGRLEEARVTLLDVLQHSPRRTDARHYLINIETQTERYASAVCYVNELLEITPYSKTLWRRKINLYNLMDNRVEANREIRRLYQIFPNDPEIKQMFNNVLKEDALKMNKDGDLNSAVKQYQSALMVTKDDEEMYLSLINLYLKLGNTNEALNTADMGLYHLPGSKEIFNKKIGILQEQHRYQEAIALVQEQQKKAPSAYYSNLLIYLTAEAARYHKNSDPYVLYGQLYDRDKGNDEAHDYLLSTAISRGYYADALAILEQDLKSNPNDKNLLSKQLLVYELLGNKNGIRRTLGRLYELYPSDSDILAKYNALAFEDAKVQFTEQNYNEALPVFIRLSENPDYGKSAKNYIYSIYLAKKNYAQAMDMIDQQIRENPGEQQYILRKIDLLAAMNDYANAYEMARQYKEQYPDNPEYKYMFKDISVAYIKYLNEREGYATIRTIADELVAEDPYNLLAYNYAIGARISMGQYAEAMEMIQAALVKFPDNKEMRLKEAGVYSQMGEHEKAVAALQKLTADYPYNHDIKGSLVEEMMLQAKAYEDAGEPFQAKAVYHEVLLVKPNDTLAAIKLANIYIARQEYPEAMKVIEDSLDLNKDNPELLYKKGVIYELMGDFRRAREFQAKYVPPAHKYEEHKDHLAYLDSQLLKNQINISYLKATADSIFVHTSVATLEYLRFARRNTFIARANYAARPTGVGVQAEADWYYTFKTESYKTAPYFIANLGFANQFFPKFKGALSLFSPVKKVYMVELGGKFARLPDDRNFITGVLGAERTFDRLWVNAKVMVMSDTEDLYNSFFAQARFYMQNEKDYVTAMTSIGTAPEDEKLEFQIDTFLTYVNTMVGAGYFHHLSHRTSFGVLGNWYNYRVNDNAYVNQYNLFLTIRTKF